MWSKVNDLMATTLLHSDIKQFSDSYHVFEGLTHMSFTYVLRRQHLSEGHREVAVWGQERNIPVGFKEKKRFVVLPLVSLVWAAGLKGPIEQGEGGKRIHDKHPQQGPRRTWVEKRWTVQGSNGERGKRSTLESEMGFRFCLRLETK